MDTTPTETSVPLIPYGGRYEVTYEAIKSVPISAQTTTDDLLDAALGRVIFTDVDGDPIPLTLKDWEWRTFEDARRTGRMIIPFTRRPHLATLWWYWRQVEQAPYGCVQQRRTYASVTVKGVTPDRHFSDAACLQAMHRLQARTDPGGIVVCEEVLWWSNRVRNEDAESVLIMLIDMAIEDWDTP